MHTTARDESSLDSARGSARAAGGASSPRPPARRAALLVDYPLLLRAVHSVDPNAVPDLAGLVRRACGVGGLLLARAYGAWYDPEEALGCFNAGIDPVFVPPVGPATVPTATSLVADGLLMIQDQRVDAVILAGDDRLFPLVAAAHSANLPVHLIGHSCHAGGPCLRLAERVEPALDFVRARSRAEKYRRPPSSALRRSA